MRLLVITTCSLFPQSSNPTAGIFFANFLSQLNRRVDRIAVVTPPPFLPRILTLLSPFAAHRDSRFHIRQFGLDVFRPPYFSARSQRHLWLQARSFCAAALPTCKALHRQFHFDGVIGYGFGPAAHTAQVAAARMGLRSVSWAIGSDVHTVPHLSAENVRFLRHTVRHNTMVLTESDALRRMIRDFCPKADHVHTFYKGIDLDGLRQAPDRTALRARLGMAADRIYMIGLGDTPKTKGVYEFYEATKSLASSWPRLSSLWVGGGPEDAPLRTLAARDGLADRFGITGLLPRPQAIEYLHAADLMAFPTYAEGLSNAVMEALAAGLPLVTTDVGGDREVCADGITGILVPPRDVPALTKGIERILENPEWASRMAQRGRRLILDHFDVYKNAAVGASILRYVAGGGDPESPVPACAGVEPGRLPVEQLEGENAAGPTAANPSPQAP